MQNLAITFLPGRGDKMSFFSRNGGVENGPVTAALSAADESTTDSAPMMVP
jgi:hypothetical protein